MKRFFYLTVLFFTIFSAKGFAQTYEPIRHKIAIFTPLYLDSVFDAGYNYRYGKNFPKFINPGLEFYYGAQMALDSLQKVGAPLEVFIYDIKSKRSTLQQQLNNPELRDVEMIIAQANPAEVKILADAAQKKKIPFISTTLPNDAGITNNPYLVVLNSTLLTHCQGIYQYLQKYHSLDNIIYFSKPGGQENMLKSYFNQIAANTASDPLKIKFVDIGNNFGLNTLTNHLDSTKRNVVVSGSLDENFGVRLSQQLATVKNTYPISVVGMPTWDNINVFSKSEYHGMDIVYSTPFYYTRYNPLGGRLTNIFENNINSRPTDMFYRGYESALRFALLLLDTKKDVASNLSRKGNYIFTSFDIQPVFLNKQNMTLDYFENKYLYFVKTINGVKTTVN